MALSATVLRDLIFDNLNASTFGPIPTNYQDQVRDVAAVIASAIVTHITTSAKVVINVTDAGLQRDPGSLLDTLAPSTPKVLPII
jgi:thiamine phosphate synthase YjbQ (UPF0047 family)